MQLVDEIIQMATEGGQPVANLLRKCLVLSYDLKNESLRRWAEQELDGYKDGDDVPEYRRAPVTAKGTFNGPFGASIANQPLPSLVMQEEHRHLAETVRLSQPISAYDIETRQNPIIEWPANLVALYQAKFIEGYALVAAWQEVPASIFVGIVDQVKTTLAGSSTAILVAEAKTPELLQWWIPDLQTLPAAATCRRRTLNLKAAMTK